MAWMDNFILNILLKGMFGEFIMSSLYNSFLKEVFAANIFLREKIEGKRVLVIGSIPVGFDMAEKPALELVKEYFSMQGASCCSYFCNS